MAWLSTEFYFYKASPPSRAVWMTLKALGNVEYEEKHTDLLKAENKRPSFVRMSRSKLFLHHLTPPQHSWMIAKYRNWLNPTHSVPTICDKGFILWESRAVMMYLCNKFATDETRHLYPLEPEARGTVDRMLFFDMGTLYQSIKDYFGPKLYYGLTPDPDKENHLKQSLDYLDNFLEKADGPYICGEKLTIADLSILASISELDAMDYAYKCYGEVSKWTDRLKSELPYYKHCTDEGIKMTQARVKMLEEDIKKQEKAAEKARKAAARKAEWEHTNPDALKTTYESTTNLSNVLRLQ